MRTQSDSGSARETHGWASPVVHLSCTTAVERGAPSLPHSPRPRPDGVTSPEWGFSVHKQRNITISHSLSLSMRSVVTQRTWQYLTRLCDTINNIENRFPLYMTDGVQKYIRLITGLAGTPGGDYLEAAATAGR